MRIDFSLELGNISAQELTDRMAERGIDYVIGTDMGTADPAFNLLAQGVKVIPGVKLITAEQTPVYIIGAVDLVVLPYNAPFNRLYELVWANKGALVVRPDALPTNWERADASFTSVDGLPFGPKCVARVMGSGHMHHFGKVATHCDIHDVADLVDMIRNQPHLFQPEVL